jgi:signal transduction histidine kinase
MHPQKVNRLEAAAHRAKERVPPIAVDLGLTVIGEATVLWGVAASQNGYRTTWPWWVWVLGVAVALPIMFRRQAPFAAWLTTGSVLLLFGFTETNAASYNHSTEFPFLVVCATVAYLGSTWQFAAAFALSLAGTFVSIHELLAKTLITMLTTSLAFTFGRLAAKQRQTSVLLAERVREAERTADARAAEAAADERTRIARDMHDILAHAVSLIVVQAEAGGAVVRTSPDKAEKVFDAIGDAGRDALIQLRRMLGVLRDDDTATLAPQPTIAALPSLIASVRSAEIDVRFVTEGISRPLPADAEIAVYRTVQESLTNVVKHARATCARVELAWGPDTLAVHIADDGVGPSPHHDRDRDRDRTPPKPHAHTRDLGRTIPPGRGLIGIRERISSCGGSVASGPGPNGRGFQVTATVPLEPIPG